MNWDQRINRAIKRGHFTEKDKDLAQNWRSCSLGERFKITTKSNDQESIINQFGVTAYLLSMNFFYDVLENNFNRAKKIHDQIKQLGRNKK